MRGNSMNKARKCGEEGEGDKGKGEPRKKKGEDR